MRVKAGEEERKKERKKERNASLMQAGL